MKPVNKTIITPRVIMSILAGVSAAILLIFVLENYILATILGLLVAISIANLVQPRETAMIGLITGVLTGLYLGWRSLPISTGLIPGNLVLETSVPVWVVITGLLCTIYGFVAGKYIELYKRGQGPFF